MKDNITKSKNQKLSLISLLSIVLLIVSIAIGVYSYKLSLREIKINADIIKLDYDSKKYTVTAEYYVNDKRYEKILVIESKTELTVNSKAEIIYDKDNPNNLINNTYYPIISGVLFITSIVLILIFIPKYLDFLKRNKDIRKMKKQGMYIDVPITEIIIDNNIKPVDGQYAYKARCRYLNKNNNQEYTYESDPCFINISQVIETNKINHVKIYFLREDTNNYYVDLDTLLPDIPVINPNIVMQGNKEEKKEEVVEKSEPEQTETERQK